MNAPFPNNRKRRATFAQDLHLDNVVLSSRSTRTRPVMAAPVAVVAAPRRLGKRPIDKALIAIAKDGVTSTNVSTTLATVTNPCTIVGLRWSLSFNQDAGTGLCEGRWAIVVARDGNSPNNMNPSDGATIYAPEQDVLAFGAYSIRNNTNSVQFDGTTKTMRKMLIGDTLTFRMSGVGTNTSAGRGIIQFFCKT